MKITVVCLVNNCREWKDCEPGSQSIEEVLETEFTW